MSMTDPNKSFAATKHPKIVAGYSGTGTSARQHEWRNRWAKAMKRAGASYDAIQANVDRAVELKAQGLTMKQIVRECM